MGSLGHADERARADDIQPVRIDPPFSLTAAESDRLHTRRNDFVEIMEMLDKRLNDKGKNWRHVFKASVSNATRGACLTPLLGSR